MTHTFDPPLFSLLAGVLEEQVLVLAEGSVVYANPAAQDFFAPGGKDLIGQKSRDLLDPAPSPAPPGGAAAILSRVASPAGMGDLVRGWVLGMDQGIQAWVLKGQASLVDIGTLTAGLAHNLAGPLSVIRSTAELFDRYLDKALEQTPGLAQAVAQWPPSVQGGLQNMVDQVDQIASATSDLLAKLRGEAARRQAPQDINLILRRVLRLMDNNPLYRRKVHLETRLDPDLPPIQGMYSDFSQSFQNLLTNALQAMEDSPEKALTVVTALQNGEVTVRFIDSGVGIPPENLERIFEPFFTTGGADRETSGLGLNSVRQLLRPYGVRFKVESRPGRTEFTLSIPRGRERDDA